MSNWNNAGRYHGGFPSHIKRQARTAIPYQCAHCGATNGLQLDHITNAATGGIHTIDNGAELVR